MKLGIADMVSNFVPGSGNPLGMNSDDWNKLEPVEKLASVIDIIARSGFEYLELGVPWLNNRDTSLPVEVLRKMADDQEIQIGSFCSLFPAELKTVGPQINWEQLTEYIHSVFRNCVLLGGDVVVFGSGGSRSIPMGYSRGKAEEDFVRVLSLMVQIIDDNKYSLRIAVEPLNTRECNFVNSLVEADTLVREVNSSNIGILIDTYHAYFEEGNFLSRIPDVIDNLFHVHVAQPEDRGWPGHLRSESDFNFYDLFKLLDQYNYQGRMTVECLIGNLESEAQLCKNHLASIRSQFAGLL